MKKLSTLIMESFSSNSFANNMALLNMSKSSSSSSNNNNNSNNKKSNNKNSKKSDYHYDAKKYKIEIEPKDFDKIQPLLDQFDISYNDNVMTISKDDKHNQKIVDFLLKEKIQYKVL